MGFPALGRVTSTLSVQYPSCEALKACFLSSFFYLLCLTAKTTNTERTSAIEIQHTAGPIIIVTSENKKSRIHTSGDPDQTIVKCVSDKPVSFLTTSL